MSRSCSNCGGRDGCEVLVRCLAKVDAPASRAAVMRGCCKLWRAAHEGDEVVFSANNPMHRNCQDVASGEKLSDSKGRWNRYANFRSKPKDEERTVTGE